jgi:SAM-dependent methyltransferase
MTNEDKTITLYKWILQEFTVEGRLDFVNYLGPHLAKLVHPGDHVLDLCCGTGPFAFFLEEYGAKVTAIDFAPYMIQIAKERALKQGSTISFIQADILTHDLGVEQFDVVAFLGNTVSDFSMNQFVQIGQKIAKALKQNGRFALHYIDGLYQFVQEEYPREDRLQAEPEKITRRFKEYLPEEAAYIEVYTNEVTGEAYEYTSYMYAPPYVRLAMDEMFALEQTIGLSAKSFLDIFLKK